MKKILVVLLILAVGTGVFAQGTWTLSGGGQVTSRINLDPDTTIDNEPAEIGASGYFDPYEQYSFTSGNVGIGYTLGGFVGNILIDTEDGLQATGNLSGENYRFQVSGYLSHLLNGTNDRSWLRNRRLWGEYKMINGMVTLEAAYNSRDTEYWVSDKTGAFYGKDALNDSEVHNFGNGQLKSFTKVDHHNYLLGNISVAGLDFGMILPNFFMSETWNAKRSWENNWSDKTAYTTPAKTLELMEDVIKQAVIGAKFTMSPLEVAMQFKVQDFGIYLGGKFTTGPVVLGLSFMGVMDDPNESHMKAGLGVDYNAGAFGAGLRGKIDVSSSKIAGSSESATIIGVEPEFFYNAIPSHLQFKVNTGFYFVSGKNADGTDKVKETKWGLQPQLFWNFNGTGASGSWYGLGTGIIVRYRIFSDVTNALDLAFKFAL